MGKRLACYVLWLVSTVLETERTLVYHDIIMINPGRSAPHCFKIRAAKWHACLIWINTVCVYLIILPDETSDAGSIFPQLSVQSCFGPHSPWYVVSHLRVICSPSTKLPKSLSSLLVVSVHVSPGSDSSEIKKIDFSTHCIQCFINCTIF